MAALRSSLRMLRRGPSVSSAAAYIGGRGMELNQVLHRAAPPPLPAVAPPPVHTAAIRNFEGCRRFSTGFGESANKAESGKRTWWQRVKYRMKNLNPEERRRIYFVYTVFVLGTPTVNFFRILLLLRE